MTGYTKLFGSIVNSTVWCAPDRHRIVWVTLLAMADMDGVIDSSIPGLAKIAAVPLPDVEEALKAFMAPDPYSRTPEHDGRRIEAWNDGQRSGWVLLNHAKYKAVRDKEERKAYQRTWAANKRSESKGVDSRQQSTESTGVDPPSSSSSSKDQETGARSASAAPPPAKVSRGTTTRGTRLQRDWKPTPEQLDYAKQLGVDGVKEAENFRLFWIAKPGAGGVKLDWDATWMTWCRRATPTMAPPPKPEKVGAKAALVRTETPLQNALNYAKQQFERGDFGEGEHGESQYRAAVKTIKLRFGVKP